MDGDGPREGGGRAGLSLAGVLDVLLNDYGSVSIDDLLSDAPNLTAERGMTVPRVNVLIPAGERRRARGHRDLAIAFRVAQSKEDPSKVYSAALREPEGPEEGEVAEEAWWGDGD